MEPKRYRDSKYLVYPDGRVWSEHINVNRFVLGEKNSHGYRALEVYQDSIVNNKKKGKFKRTFIHRMVAECFIPNPLHKPHINHKNGIKDDNRIENLEWCTPAENNTHAIETGLVDHSLQRLFNDDEVKEMKLLSSWGVKQANIAKKFNTSSSTVNHILSYKTYRYLDIPEINYPKPEYVLNAYKNGEISLEVALDIISGITNDNVLKSLTLQV